MSDCCEEPKMIYWPHVVVNETHEEDIHTFTFIFIILVIINALLNNERCICKSVVEQCVMFKCWL